MVKHSEGKWQCSNVLGGGFQHFLCSSLSGEDEPNLTSINFHLIKFREVPSLKLTAKAPEN